MLFLLVVKNSRKDHWSVSYLWGGFVVTNCENLIIFKNILIKKPGGFLQFYEGHKMSQTSLISHLKKQLKSHETIFFAFATIQATCTIFFKYLLNNSSSSFSISCLIFVISLWKVISFISHKEKTQMSFVEFCNQQSDYCSIECEFKW